MGIMLPSLRYFSVAVALALATYTTHTEAIDMQPGVQVPGQAARLSNFGFLANGTQELEACLVAPNVDGRIPSKCARQCSLFLSVLLSITTKSY
jgi:hypothetical protein